MSNFFEEYTPIIYKLEKTNSKKVLDTSNDILFSNNIAYPEINLGFHHFIHATKDKMQFLKSAFYIVAEASVLPIKTILFIRPVGICAKSPNCIFLYLICKYFCLYF